LFAINLSAIAVVASVWTDHPVTTSRKWVSQITVKGLFSSGEFCTVFDGSSMDENDEHGSNFAIFCGHHKWKIPSMFSRF